jgi:hypothetical protein
MAERNEVLTLSGLIGRHESPFDIARWVKNTLPKERRGYVLARFALSYSHASSFSQYAMEALEAVFHADCGGDLRPPLPPELAEGIGVYLNDVNAGDRNLNSPLTRLLLSQVIDNGSSERFTSDEHRQAHLDPQNDFMIRQAEEYDKVLTKHVDG